MNMLTKLRDYFFKDAIEEDPIQRTELLITLALTVLSTLLLFQAYASPPALIAAVLTNLIGILALYRAFQSKYKYLNVFPVIAALAICVAAISDGKGTHDLLWIGNLGLLVLANIRNGRKLLFPVLLSILMVLTFTVTGLAEVYGALNNIQNTNIGYIGLNALLLAAMMAVIIVVFHRHHSTLRKINDERNAYFKNAQELTETNQSLENRLKAYTSELEDANKRIEERATRLQVISEISQEISSNLEQQLSDLLDRIVQVISERLGFYHVGIFLLDESREYAVLHAANSEGGQNMLARHHQLRVGGTGIVGYVSQGGRARIALDTGSDAVFFGNPDLPKTRSEMALPLKYGSQIIGVLDLQSTMPSAFKEEDAILIGALANQIAIAINNILTNKQSGFSDTYRTGRYSRKLIHTQKQSGYSYNNDGTISTSESIADPTLERALTTGETAQTQPSKNNPSVLAVPVKFRDQVIGVIHVESTAADRRWTEDEITVVQSISERAAMALENARLLEQTRRRAEQEEAIASITSQIGASTNLNHILQATVEELGRTLGTTRTFIQLETPSNSGSAEQNPETD
jgi:GAF domain-containing protein